MRAVRHSTYDVALGIGETMSNIEHTESISTVDQSFWRTLPVWWSFFWRATLYCAIAAAISRTSAYVISANVGADMKVSMHLATVICYIAYLPISFIAIKQALSRRNDS